MKNTLFPGDVVLVLKKNICILNKKIDIYKIRQRDVLIFEKNTSEEESFYFIKRCIGKQNDLIKIIGSGIFVNNEKEHIPEKTIIYKKNFDLSLIDNSLNDEDDNTLNVLRAKQDLNRKKYKYDSICYNFWIPAIDSSIPCGKKFLKEHWFLIKIYEDTSDIEKNIDAYKFQNNYYYMIGDNRPSSSDSRNWGCIPEKSIIGKAIIVLFSIEYSYEGRHKLRRNRILKIIN